MVEYEYDDQSQLLSESYYTYLDDGPNNADIVTWHYTYDTAGNILSRYKTNDTKRSGVITQGSPTETKTYTYSTGDWKDLLTAVNGSPIVYEGQTYSGGTVTGPVKSGNPIRYTNGTKTYTGLTWQHGRQLASLTTGGKTSTFEYDHEGIRTRKIYNSVYHDYITQGGKVVRETVQSAD